MAKYIKRAIIFILLIAALAIVIAYAINSQTSYVSSAQHKTIKHYLPKPTVTTAAHKDGSKTTWICTTRACYIVSTN